MARISQTGGKGRAAKARKDSPRKGGDQRRQAKKARTAATPDKPVLDPQLVIADLERRLNEVRAELVARNSAHSERIAYQAAANDVLKAMSASPGDPQPVFDLISVRARDLCDAYGVTVYEFDGSLLHWRAATGVSDDPVVRAAAKAAFPLPPTSDLVAGRAILSRAIVHIRDYEREPDLRRFSGAVNSTVAVPILRRGVPIGALQMGSRERGGFSDAQVGLLETFADQAAIAIENTQLFNETKEALERQTATADILTVIASSPHDVQPVFEAIGESANKLVGAHGTTVLRIVGDMVELAAFTPVGKEADAVLQSSFPLPIAGNPHYEKLRRGEIAEAADTEAAHSVLRNIARARGYRSRLLVPLKDDSGVIGAISVTRKEPGAFAAHHVQLLQTFADQAVIAIQNVRLFNETKEALEQQTATADILKVIASSPSDTQPVFEAIVQSGLRLFPSSAIMVVLADDGIVRPAAIAEADPGLAEMLRRAFPVPLTRDYVHAVAILDKRVVDIPDAQIETNEFPVARRQFLSSGHRAITIMPMMRGDQSIGALSVVRQLPGPLSDRQLELLKTFADQAVIAIENTRLISETKEALERQTATAEILKVIASSPDDVQPVFEAIAERSNRLIGGHATAVYRVVDQTVVLAAFTRVNPEADAALRASFPRPLTDLRHFEEVVGRGEIVQIADTETADIPDYAKQLGRVRGFRSYLFVPLAAENGPIGLISVTRAEPGAFAEHDVNLLKTFADQAVIAISNVDLFEEVQQRTRDLSEALTYQTGSGNILSVIASSPTDVGPVLMAIVENACELCGAYDAIVRLKEGDHLVPSAHHGPTPTNADKWLIERKSISGLAVIGKKPVHIRDMQSSEGNQFPESQRRARELGHRTILSVPLLREGESIGVIVLRRTEAEPFADKQIALLQTFADQAVIAIGNVRLFEEVQARTRDLSEALTYQTGSANILKVIASSPTDVTPVLDAIVKSACELCDAYDAIVRLKDGEYIRFGAHLGPIPPVLDERIAIDRSFITGRAIIDRQTIHLHDVFSTEGAEFPGAREMSQYHGIRTILCAPMLREGESIGAILLRRTEVNPFTNKQIALLQTFADQAVIAIENTRLFHETQEALERQTATAEILKVIASSAGDLSLVFDKMLEDATRVCGAEFGSMNLLEGDMLRQAALYNAPAAFAAERLNKAFRVHPRSSLADAIRGKQVVQVEDMRLHPAYIERNRSSVELTELAGARTIVVVPMLRQDEVIGVITVYRQEVRPFSDEQVELLTNFASQAVIAIENTRLLRELRQRTDDLSEALVYQTGSSNILKVIASSPTDVEPALKAIVESACEICDAYDAVLFLKDGDDLVFAAHHGPIRIDFKRWPINRKWITGRAVVDKAPQHIRDLQGPEGDDLPEARELARFQVQQRTVLSVPLLQESEAIGVISLRRVEVQPFSDKQSQLLKSFADQAVIAISNARLFEQVQERTRELSRSLEDLRTAQDRLVQTEKLASLGQLTAGIAHEIKNPLNFVNNFSALSAELIDELNDLLKHAALTDDMREEVNELIRILRENLEKVEQHGKRADSIVKNMLLHSREGLGEQRVADINTLVDESLNLAYHGRRAEKSGFNITLQRDFDAGAGSAELYPQEITRALLNLISNGFYAASKRKSENGQSEFEPTLLATTKSLGSSVEIRIRDNGAGIPPEVKEKMFNPFFTTKPAGEGTGLGLSMTHDIVVKQHGGRIDVETEPGKFTEFTIVLPRSGAKQQLK
jgi:GAF domain-containing protein